MKALLFLIVGIFLVSGDISRVQRSPPTVFHIPKNRPFFFSGQAVRDSDFFPFFDAFVDGLNRYGNAMPEAFKNRIANQNYDQVSMLYATSEGIEGGLYGDLHASCSEVAEFGPKIMAFHSEMESWPMEQKWAVVLHELGHCLLGRDHDNRMVVVNGTERPASIMYEFSPSREEALFIYQHRDAYLQELLTTKRLTLSPAKSIKSIRTLVRLVEAEVQRAHFRK